MGAKQKRQIARLWQRILHPRESAEIRELRGLLGSLQAQNAALRREITRAVAFVDVADKRTGNRPMLGIEFSIDHYALATQNEYTRRDMGMMIARKIQNEIDAKYPPQGMLHRMRATQ